MKGGEKLVLTGVIWPEGKKATFGFSGEPLSVYEGEVRIPASIKIAKDAPTGPTKLELTLTAQPCSNKSCLLPIDHKLPLTITIAAPK